MGRWLRILGRVAVAGMAAVWVVSAALWVRSYWVGDIFQFVTESATYSLRTAEGRGMATLYDGAIPRGRFQHGTYASAAAGRIVIDDFLGGAIAVRIDDYPMSGVAFQWWLTMAAGIGPVVWMGWWLRRKRREGARAFPVEMESKPEIEDKTR